MDKKIEQAMWELHCFINGWAELADEGIQNERTNSFIEAIVDTAERLKKLYTEEKKMKKFTLKDYKAFCEEALIMPPFEDDEQIEEWFETHKVHIIVNGCVMELEYDADTINEIEFSLKEIHEALLGDGTPTTGNTKITSAYLLSSYLKKEYDRMIENGNDVEVIYHKFISATKHQGALSDLSECIRIENDLRGSEVEVLYKDFENDKLRRIIRGVLQDFLMSKFEVEYASDGDKSFLMFYGRESAGEVITFSWGMDDFDTEKQATIDNMLDSIEETYTTK